MENGSKLTLSFTVIGPAGTNVEVQYAPNAKPSKYSRTIPKAAYVTFTMQPEWEVRGADTVEQRGMHIMTDHAVSIVAVDSRVKSSDSYSVLPTHVLGKAYVVAGYQTLERAESFQTQCDIIATEDNTLVTLTEPEYLHPDSIITWTKTLNRGDVYQLRHREVDDAHIDYSGLYVLADHPIAFLTGHRCAQVPLDVSFCNMLVEESPSIENFGTKWVAPLIQWKNYISIRVTATADHTIVSMGTTSGLQQLVTLRAGQSYTNDTLSSSTYLTTSKPAIAAVFGQSADASFPEHAGDPFMILLTPLENRLQQCSVYVPGTDDDHAVGGSGWGQYLAVVTSADVAEILIDGTKVQPTKSEVVAGSDERVYQYEVQPGIHSLSSSVPFAAYSYGIGLNASNYDAYGHTCGQLLNVMSERNR